ncbi:MAG: tetratricopeptide repeat protein [Sphingomonadaceae bacterium]|jgi:tetratricopeptide (TPR) repeat protein
MKLIFRIALLSSALAFGSAVQASSDPQMDAQVQHINDEWARIKYQVRGKSAQYAQLAALQKQASAVAAKYPGKAEPLLWLGIVTSEEASVAGMFEQLGLAKSARATLQRAYAIDPHASHGGVAMSLGVLYYKVPGWPVAFGDTGKAKGFLQASLAADPNGLDANWFYGDYLYAQGQKAAAKTFLQKALRAPADPDRSIWDSGRRGEVRSLLAKIG